MKNKIYTKISEKIIDLICGIFIIFLATFSIYFCARKFLYNESLFVFASFAITFFLEVLFIIYFFMRRRYIGIGMIVGIVLLPIVAFSILLGTCMASFYR